MNRKYNPRIWTLPTNESSRVFVRPLCHEEPHFSCLQAMTIWFVPNQFGHNQSTKKNVEKIWAVFFVSVYYNGIILCLYGCHCGSIMCWSHYKGLAHTKYGPSCALTGSARHMHTSLVAGCHPIGHVYVLSINIKINTVQQLLNEFHGKYSLTRCENQFHVWNHQ